MICIRGDCWRLASIRLILIGNKMTIKEIREAYLECIEPRILNAEKYAGDTNFDILRDIWSSPYGYELFYPMTSAYMEFDALCNLWDWIKYCWDDDGSTSFVCATITTPFSSAMKKYFKVEDTIHDIDPFIMRGERDILNWDEVESIALTHDSMKSTLVSYVATTFREEDLHFLHGLIPEMKRIEILGKHDCGSDEAESYFKERHLFKAKLKAHIESSKYVFQVCKGETRIQTLARNGGL